MNIDCSGLQEMLTDRLGKVGDRLTQGRVSMGIRAVPALLNHPSPCEVRSKA